MDQKIKDKKLRYDINRETIKILAKIYLSKLINMNILEKVLPSNQCQIIQQTKFTYSPIGKAFEKQARTIENQGREKVKASKVLKAFEEQKSRSVKDMLLKE